MLNICEKYAQEHNLRFSTDENPMRSKTKCIAFQRKAKPLTQMTLCGNSLPWVKNAKHLGNHLESRIEGQKSDIKIKRANYIRKNNEIMQEFSFSHPRTKVLLNNIYNSHLTGSVLWDLFSRESAMMENTWNSSVRIMYDLPRQTHRYLIEPISGTKHIRYHLVKRFLSFITQIEKSNKQASNLLLKSIKHNPRTTTGSNLRKILLMTEKKDVNELVPSDCRFALYHPIEEYDAWKVGLILEATDIIYDRLDLKGFGREELKDIREYLCCS